MALESIPETRWSEIPIVCPSCGNHGEEEGKWSKNAAVPFKLVEDVVRSFEFSADLDEHGRLWVVADVHSDVVDWESGANLRIECMACFDQFPISDSADVDFA